MAPPDPRSPHSPESGTTAPGGGQLERPGTLTGLARALGARERFLWSLALLLLAVDLATTVFGLGLGLSEANPAAAALLDRYGIVALGVLKGFALTVAAAGRLVIARDYRPLVPICLAVPWSVGSLANVVIIARVFG